jgi:uncharacterized protein
MSPTSTLPAWFACAIDALKAGDTDGYVEIYAPDAVHVHHTARRPGGALP